MKLFNFLLKNIQTKTLPPREVSRHPLIKIKNVIFGKYLLTTNTITAGLLMVAGDMMSQEIEQRGVTNKKRYDWERCGKMFLVGAIQGPIHHYVYRWMDALMPVVNIKNVTKKVLLDQLVMSPFCIVAFFYPAGWLNRQTTSECTTELKEKFLTVYVTDWLFWPAAQFVNFYYLDTKYRVLYVNFITMIYNVFLSYVKYNEQTWFQKVFR